jgi:hypothetical protein
MAANPQVGKQVVITLSEVRAVRRVVKQLQCSSSVIVQAAICRHIFPFENAKRDFSISQFVLTDPVWYFFCVCILQDESLLNSQTAGFLDRGLQKLIPQYDTCLNSGSDCIQKSLKNEHIFCV